MKPIKNRSDSWSAHQLEAFPSVKWKLVNLEKFRKKDPENYRKQLGELEKLLAL